ncbi:MAG: hypothetical protein OXH31_00725 [Gammaproteobacteria bacterium]|nr:hypothetical protein [Gammaproteobacteria bacterium]
MEITSSWVKPPQQVGGQDHLGVQALGMNIYGRLLPGITNTTDRARYYSFYPWLIWSFDRLGYRNYDDEFKERFRRADCLFTLIALRHADVTGSNREDHAGAMVGSNTLGKVVRELSPNESLALSDYSLHEAKDRYFKNPLGGLGQYYLGVLRELKMLAGDTSRGLKYTRQFGQEIAKRINNGFDGDLFLKLVESDTFTGEQLDTLSTLCPCQLRDNLEEAEFLIDLLFARGRFYSSEALSRRHSLQTILHLSNLLSTNNTLISEATFRSCAYSSGLPNNQSWLIPDFLAQNRARWAIYARHELLSVATQGLFHALLDGYRESGRRFHTSAQIADWFVNTPEVLQALNLIGTNYRFPRVIELTGAQLPPLTHWTDQYHEIRFTGLLVDFCRNKSSAENRRHIVFAALRILISLAHRFSNEHPAYGDLVFEEGYFIKYPINLRSFRSHLTNTWATMTLTEVLRWLLQYWGVDNHLWIALRKLRGKSESTFRIRPSDQGLNVIEIPPAVHTGPRFNQSIRILKDVGIFERVNSGHWALSDRGMTLLKLDDAP